MPHFESGDAGMGGVGPGDDYTGIPGTEDPGSFTGSDNPGVEGSGT